MYDPCMRILGLIGGTTWHSTVVYYRRLNELVNERVGPLSSCESLLYTVPFADVERNARDGNRDANEKIFVGGARKLRAGGAEAIVLCANTPHMFASQIEADTRLPVIHIAEATAKAIALQGLSQVGLLGTKFVMEMDFLKDVLARHGIECIVPGDEDRAYVHDSIFREFAHGRFLETTKAEYIRIMRDLQGRGAEGIVLGCTEIPMLIRQDDFDLPTFDTTELHVRSAVDFALS
jgi:aspartate racemase